MPVYVVETTRRCAAAWSRHCQFVRTPTLEGSALIDVLVGLGTRLGSRPVLILTSDQSVTAVSEHRAPIEDLYRISLPTAPMVQALADKALFQQLAAAEGFEVPRGVCVASAREIEWICQLLPPLVVKPADKTLALNEIVERAERASTLAEAQTIAARMLARAPSLVVQEWVEGADTEIFFTLFSCGPNGELLGLFTGRKLVCSPPAVGNTAICVAAPEVAAELTARTLAFLVRVGYRGLGSLEFKRDTRNGRFIIIEPTVGRTDWQEEIAALCGVNLPLLTYWAEIGRPVPAPIATSPPSPGWRSSMEFRRPRELAKTKTRLVDGFFRWSDPLPAVYYYAYERCAVRLWQRAARVAGY
jgi:D-aspartate ligase